MPQVTYEDLKKELESGKYRPIYLLMGEEPYYIDVISSYIEEHAIAEHERDFNMTIFYGKDTTAKVVAHEADQYPMMAQRRVVIVREAQELPGLADLELYASHCVDSTVLVLCHKYKSVDKRLKLTKTIEKVGAVMETKRLYDNQMPTWIANYMTQQGLQPERKAVELMAESIGTNLSGIVSAVEKLKVALSGSKSRKVDADLVSANVGISKEYNTFELRDALLMRNVPKANRIVHAFEQNEKNYPVQAIVSMLFTTYSKLLAFHTLRPDEKARPEIAANKLSERPFAIQRTYEPAARNYDFRKCLSILGMLHEYDMRSKGFQWPAVSSGELLKELVFRIMN